MSALTVIWSMSAAVSLTLGGIQLVAWLHDRRGRANLIFSIIALAVSVLAMSELALMRMETAEEYARLHRWLHVPLFFVVIGLIAFIWFYFRTGRCWLAWTVVALRAFILVINFTTHPSFNYRAITSMVPVRFLGETVFMPVALPSPWARLGEGSALLGLLFVIDASITLWRKGDADERRRALMMGGSVCLCILFSTINGLLIHTGMAHIPYFVSLFFLMIVMAMGYELSRDMARAARMADELRENAESMTLAATAAKLAFWRWDIDQDKMWVSPNGRALYGILEGSLVTLARFLATLHPEDREAVGENVRSSMETDGIFQCEYRVVLPDGEIRWIAARGEVEFDDHRRSLAMRGVSIDFTERKTAEIEAAQHRNALSHLTRVTTLSELSGSLAHELNQPLASILSNSQAAQRLLAQSPPDVEEVREILIDIVSEDRRAGEIIQRLRSMLKRGESSVHPLPLNEVITEVLHLTRAELISHGVTVTCELASDLPEIPADRIQLQQVLLNLILNGADAMATCEPGTRQLRITTARHGGMARVSVGDEGTGLATNVERLFDPFYTTKTQGLGMGLAICRSIISAHHGRLWAEPHPERGAVFHFEIPLANESLPGILHRD